MASFDVDNFVTHDPGELIGALGALDQALRDNPLPPFEVIAEYMAPGGGMLVSDPTGIHYMTFGLKRQ